LSLDCHEDLYQLTDLTRRFQKSLRQVTEGARYRRGGSRMDELAEHVRRSRAYLELALAALEGRADCEDPEDGEAQANELPTSHSAAPASDSAWVQDKVAGLARYLTQGAGIDVPTDVPLEEVAQLDDEVIGLEDGADPPWPPALAHGRDGVITIPLREDEEESSGEAESSQPGFSGDCTSMPVPDLLAMLQAQGKTGVLTITHTVETINLHFDRGELVHAYSEHPPEGMRLGEILLKQGAITQKKLNSVLFDQFSAAKRQIGDVLRECEMVTDEELEQALTQQVQELFHRLFRLADAVFRFSPGLPPAPENRARRNVVQLLLESARIHDEREAG